MARDPQPCDHCQTLAAVRYRIQAAAQGCWQLVCPDCQASLSRNNPHYRYGGTWKADRKR